MHGTNIEKGIGSLDNKGENLGDLDMDFSRYLSYCLAYGKERVG